MIRSRFVSAALLAIGLAGCALAPPPSATVPVRMIGINDFHGALESRDLFLSLADPTAPATPMRVAVGSAAALKGIVQRLRAEARHSIMVGSGDLIGASPLASMLFRDEPTVEILGEMGLEVSSVGNHEFDNGLRELMSIMQGG
jgi:5'-nucleotidase